MPLFGFPSTIFKHDPVEIYNNGEIFCYSTYPKG
jgi:hypothetical protein